MRIPILFVVLCCGLLSAQAQGTYLENFENGMPADYHLVNLDGLTPDDPDLATLADSAWTTRFISSQGWTNGNAAFSVSWYQNDAGPSNDWMVTPAISIGANAVLTWDAMAITSSGDFRDRYQVFIGTDTAISSFSALAPVYDTGDTGEVVIPVARMIDLAANGYQNQTIHIAFRNFTQPYNSSEPVGPGNGGNELAIDNIQVTDVVGVEEALSRNFTSLDIFPQPANDAVRVRLALEKPEDLMVHIYNLHGQVVAKEVLGRFAQGEQETHLDISQLAPGSYLMHFFGDNSRGTQRLVIQR